MRRGCVVFINKFRGDPKILDGGLDFIRPHIGSAQLAVLPYLDLELEEEDRIRPRHCPNPEVDIAVVYLPHIANATDFEYLAVEHNVSLRFVRHAAELVRPTPSSCREAKHLLGSRLFASLWPGRCAAFPARQDAAFGICGGFEMLGGTLFDPDQTESKLGSLPGLGLWRLILSFSATSWCVRVVIFRRNTTCCARPGRSKGTKFILASRSIAGRCRCLKGQVDSTERSTRSA